ncbi:polysaccharide deacetylase family protein [Chitinophagaceae bacterium LB-8]|uniref:Polysaccharide deacetylase family protein n=1 Tax=Paraflavisolibacter caeni TaxID=2982496 RepID=A0A9X2XUH8_9BACT|nr:polysaccharide deacetylase family protein [Paraflavisolibacter caeni]MCU7548727.1 polysaccharide deacetylase family protein [Paraflavisolibacter caeni]
MHRFFIKTPWLVQRYFSSYVWFIPTKEKVVFLTFDDGPHPDITPFVLDELKKFDANATFFCVGSNVVKYPETYQRIIAEGHAVGNHTQNHVNGWKVASDIYLNNVSEGFKHIDSRLFRPPYGRIKKDQATSILQKYPGTKIIMWDVLSADFDKRITPERCLKNVVKNISSGSIIVFHDSAKAFRNLKYALPKTLEKLSLNGYRMERINQA